MARSRSTEIQLRNTQIRADAAKGMSKTALAQKYGKSVTRICQILAEDISVADAEERAFLAVGYQGGMERLQEIIDGPGRPITSGAGKHVIDEVTGQPAYDPSPVVDAIRTKFQGLNNMAKLLGSDKPPPKPVEQPAEFQVWVEEFRRLTTDNQSLQRQVAQLTSQLALLDGVHQADVIEG